jgi:SNF2 family DNA or RNA helicase
MGLGARHGCFRLITVDAASRFTYSSDVARSSSPPDATSIAPPISGAVRRTVTVAPSSSPLPDIPPPPAAGAIPVAGARLDAGALAALLGRANDDLAQVSIAVRAHQLATAQAFQELLSLSSLAGVESYTYQLETVRRVVRVLRGRALLADEVGLGKTVEAMMVLREYQLRGMARRVLVLVPPALVRQWTGELAVKAGVAARNTDDPMLREAPDQFWGEEGVVVASLATARRGRHAQSVAGISWDLVIVDEAHHIKNRQTLAWKLVNELKSRFLLLLTATPIATDLEEIYNLVTLLRPGQLTTPAAFRAQFVDPRDPTSPRNHEHLRRLLAEVMVRNTRAQSGLKLPPRFVTTIALERSENEHELYADVVRALREHAENHRSRMLASTLLLEAGSSTRAMRATIERALVELPATDPWRARLDGLLARARGVVDSTKSARLVDIVKGHEMPVLVFTRFRETLADIAEALEEAGIDVVPFQGGQSGSAKQQALEQFRSGARVMVATDVGAEGQNLQFCHVLVNYDLPWNPMLLEQRIGRLHRMGQTKEVRVYNLCARGTVEERILDVLDRRLHLFELVVGEIDMVLGNIADERDLEERILHLYATSRSDAEVDRGFDAIADELAAARTGYERTRRLDEQLFRRDFET